MSGNREDRYKYSAPVTTAILDKDGQEDSSTRTTETKTIKQSNGRGGTIRRTSVYQNSGKEGKVLLSYTDTEYDDQNKVTAIKRYNRDGRLIYQKRE